MAKRRDLIADGQALIKDLILAPLFTAGLASIANQKEVFYPPVNLGTAALVGATGAVAYHLFGRSLLERLNRPVSRTATLASIQRAPAYLQADPDVQTWIMKWRDRQTDVEFIYSGLGVPSPMPESEFERFVKLAWRRQVNAVYGSRVNMVWTGGNFKRLTRNQIFSEQYFQVTTRPRFSAEDYYSCLYILALTRLIRGRRQGRGGELMYPFERTVNEARTRWLRLLSPIQDKKSTFFGIFSTRGSSGKFN